METSHSQGKSLSPLLGKLLRVPLVLFFLYLLLLFWVFVFNATSHSTIRRVFYFSRTSRIGSVIQFNNYLFSRRAWGNKLQVVIFVIFGSRFLLSLRGLYNESKNNLLYMRRNFVILYKFQKSQIKRFTDKHFGRVSEDLIMSRDWTLKQLQEGYLNLLFHRHIFNTPENKECHICMEKYMKRHFVDFSGCNHGVCIHCFRKYLNKQLYDGECIFLCPFGDDECTSLGQKDISRASKNDTMFSRKLEKSYIRHGLKDLEGDYYECPTEECLNVVFCEYPLVEKKILQNFPRLYKKELDTSCDLRSFTCTECNYSYCLLCKRSWTFGDLTHDKIDCESYRKERRKSRRLDELLRTQAAVERGIKQNRLRRCPKCSEIIEKNGGCPHIVCRSCNTNFCWKCAKLWGPPPGCYGGCPDVVVIELK